MQAVEELEYEHVLIHELLRCLESLTLEAHTSGVLDEKTSRPLLRLFERFVDHSHQDKEEHYLFPHLLARATADEAERLERVIREHAQERRRLVAMYLHLDGASRGRAASVDRFVANAILYQRLQRKHLETEDTFVLPLAAAILTAEGDRQILLGFQEIDARLGADLCLEEQIAALSRRCGLEHVEKRKRVPELIGA